MKEKLTLVLVVCFFSAIFAGCNGSVRFALQKRNTPQISSGEHFSYETRTVMSEAEKWLGTPYCYGGESKKCTDCSGFVQKVYQSAGIFLPRTAASQFNYAEKISVEESTAGDLVFFSSHKSINHVGIYLGNNIFIHSGSTNGVEKQSLSNSYYRSRFVGFGRVLSELSSEK